MPRSSSSRTDRADKVGLTFHVRPDRRQFVKITAAELDVTMDRVGSKLILLLEQGLKSPDPTLRKLTVKFLTNKTGSLAGKDLLAALLEQEDDSSSIDEPEKED